MPGSFRTFLITLAAVSVAVGWGVAATSCASAPPPPPPPPEKPEVSPAAEPGTAKVGELSKLHPGSPGSTDPAGGTTGGDASGTSADGAPAHGTSGGASLGGSSGGGAGGPPMGGSSPAGGTSTMQQPAGSAPRLSFAAAPTTSPQTPEERRAALDKRLNDSLGSFDAKLRAEQQRIANERDARQVAVTTVSASDADSSTGDGNRRRGGGRSSHAGDLGSDAGDLKSDRATGNVGVGGNGAVANEIPDGNDDDVVARRLRKAAEQETDPELKDKLWKEYVEYKKNTQTK